MQLIAKTNKPLFYATALLALTMMLFSCTQRYDSVDALMRSRVDALNKNSFKERFNDAAKSEVYARRALALVNDSLPDYHDGKLRAWNNIANAYYNRALHDSVMIYVDSILSYEMRSENRELEQVLAHLLESRLKQRNCDIAGSYQILHNLEESGLLNNRHMHGSPMLLDLARSEFYITTTTLNYHYRSKSQYEQSELLAQMEEFRKKLMVDYAEDLSLNYAIAYGYYALCNDTVHQSEYLEKALLYCRENITILSDSTRFCTYHLGNTYQLLGFMLWSPKIEQSSWQDNQKLFDEICDLVAKSFHFYIKEQQDLCYAFMQEATALFWLHNDPYQRLGAVVATGRYCMTAGDTAAAQVYFTEALIDSTMTGIAPKFEAMLYEGLLISGCAQTSDEVTEWTRHELELLSYIKQNEKADFMLQLELEKVRRNKESFMVFSIVLSALALALLTTLLLLRRRSKALQQETARLQEAKRQDVERIANVETCLSVLRHDITPFVSYLQNEKLPDELRHEVTEQLIRTFENIKNWTNLSIPSGLQFRCSETPIQAIFDNVRQSVNNFRGTAVTITFENTSLAVRGDRLLLEIMLRNLVNNAVQHTEKGSVDIMAKVCNDDSRFVQVSVKDTGCGMNADEVENLFRADKKPKQTSKKPEDGSTAEYGTGFGLILCRYIIKKHDDNTIRGCRIWAESKLGEGRIFHFCIQRANADNDEKQ